MSTFDPEQLAGSNRRAPGEGDEFLTSELSADASSLGGGHQSNVLSQRELGLVPFRGRASQPMIEMPRPSSDICPLCKNTGWLSPRNPLPYDHPNYKSKVECKCLLERRRLKRLQEMLNLCVRFGFQREKVLATYRPQVSGVQQAFRQAKRLVGQLQSWAADREERRRKGDTSKVLHPREWLVFIGPVGVGKSHLGMAIANAALDADIVTLFATVPDLLDHLRQSFNPSSEVFYDELFERFKNAELLVLDDLGAEQSNSWVDEKLFQLLNYRYNLCLPTVVTLNKQAWDYLDLRLKSRLSDRSLVEIVSLDQAKDYREQQGKAPRE